MGVPGRAHATRTRQAHQGISARSRTTSTISARDQPAAAWCSATTSTGSRPSNLAGAAEIFFFRFPSHHVHVLQVAPPRTSPAARRTLSHSFFPVGSLNGFCRVPLPPRMGRGIGRPSFKKDKGPPEGGDRNGLLGSARRPTPPSERQPHRRLGCRWPLVCASVAAWRFLAPPFGTESAGAGMPCQAPHEKGTLFRRHVTSPLGRTG